MVMPNVYPAMALAPQTAQFIGSDSPLSWYYKGREERLDNERRGLLKEAGGLAAQGNISGATGALFRGGDVGAAVNLSNWDTGRRTEALKLILDGARRADTPARWAALVNSVERTFGPEMVGQYRDFNSRPAAMTELERAQLQLSQLELSHKQQMMPLQLEQIRGQIATAQRDQEIQRQLIGAALGSAPAAAPQAAPPAPPALQSSPLGPVTPRRVGLLPINDETSAAMIPPAPPAAPPPVTPPPAPTFQQRAQELNNRLNQPLGPGGLPPGPQPTVAPQVRGWEGTDDQPDFVGTPLARGVQPGAQPQSAQPQQTPATTQPATAPSFSGIFAAMSPERRLAAAALIAKKDYAAFAKLLNEMPPEEKAAAEARGKAMGEARAALPAALQGASSFIRNIDAVIDDPNRTSVTGWQGQEWWRNPQHPSLFGFGSLPINPIAFLPTASSTIDTQERIRQVQGQAFMQAYQSLKGGGAISDQEGAAARAAIARLDNLGQSDEGYQRSLLDARREIWNLMNLARTRAGVEPIPYQPHKSEGGGGQQPGTAAPAPGSYQWTPETGLTAVTK